MQIDNRDLLRKGLIPDWIDDLFLKSVTPFINYFTKHRVDPNSLTIGGFLLNVIGAVCIGLGWFPAATAAIGAGGVCDFIDGKVAKKSTRMTKYGDVLDDVLDRYSDVLLFLGVACFALLRQDAPLVLMSVLTVVGSLMTSYLKAVSTNYGQTFRMGAVRRQERITFLFLGALLAFLDPSLRSLLIGIVGLSPGALPPSSIPVTVVVLFLAISTNLTALQRFITLGRLVRDPGPDGKSTDVGKAVLTR